MVQLQLLQHYWSWHKLGLLWYWMVCLGNKQRSFCHFWDCIQVLHSNCGTGHIFYNSRKKWLKMFHLLWEDKPMHASLLSWTKGKEVFYHSNYLKEGFPVGSVGKELVAIRETQKTWVWSLGWEDPLEERMATHFSILAWRTPRTEEPSGLQSIVSQKVSHDWSSWAYTPKQKKLPCLWGSVGSPTLHGLQWISWYENGLGQWHFLVPQPSQVAGLVTSLQLDSQICRKEAFHSCQSRWDRCRDPSQSQPALPSTKTSVPSI